MKDHILNYLNFLKKDESYRQTEHTCRTFLQNLLKELSEPKKIILIHEPKRDHKGRGSPNFCFKFHDMNLGFLENKQVGQNLNKLLKSDQVTKYKTLTKNLIITDYLRWIWIYDENVVKDVRLCEETLLEKRSHRIFRHSNRTLYKAYRRIFKSKIRRNYRGSNFLKDVN